MRVTGCTDIHIMRLLPTPVRRGRQWSRGLAIIVDDEDSRTTSGVWQPGDECRHAYGGEDTGEDLLARALR
jgi:hypothetical protein